MKISNECISCGTCQSVCPMGAVCEGGMKWKNKQGEEKEPLSEDHYFIIPEKCIRCRACYNACPIQCIEDKE